MKELVSIVIPSYNHAKYLGRCIERALGQTYAEVEVILVDDRSKDDSVEVARAVKDTRLHIHVNEANMGAYATENRGIDFARGRFIAILNSDDFWASNKLENQLEAMEGNKCPWSYTLGALVDENDKDLGHDQHADWPRDPTQNLLPELLSKNRLLASSVVFERGKVRFLSELRYSGDWMAALSLAERFPVACVAEPLTFWRQHDTNSYTRSRAVTLEEIRVRTAIIARAGHWMTVGQELSAVQKGLHDCAIDLAALYVLVGDMRAARKAAKRALAFHSSPTALKRRIVTNLPKAMARQRLWPSEPSSEGNEAELSPLDLTKSIP